MEDKNMVSVVMPCFNHGAFIKEAIDSVLDSTYNNIEIIIVNDGSTDNYTNEVLESIRHPKIKIFYQDNLGPAVARNHGIKQSSGKYIMPLDSDDKIYPEYISKAVRNIEEREDVGIVYCKAELFGQVSEEWLLPEFILKNFLKTNCIFATSLFKKEDWLRVGGYKEIMRHGLEDWEFYISLIENGVGVYRIPEVLFCYRKNGDSRSKVTKEENMQLYRTIIKLHPRIYIDNIEDTLPLFNRVFGKKRSKLAKLFNFK